MHLHIPLRVQGALKNPHTTWSGGIYFFVAIAANVASVWWPEHRSQIKDTADYLKAGAIGWLALTAGDAGKAEADNAATNVRLDQTVDAVKFGNKYMLPVETKTSSSSMPTLLAHHEQ
jgi:hypothetical protein